MKKLEINKESIKDIIQVIAEYEAHDREAFNTRTEFFRIVMEMALKLDELLSDRKM